MKKGIRTAGLWVISFILCCGITACREGANKSTQNDISRGDHLMNMDKTDKMQIWFQHSFHKTKPDDTPGSMQTYEMSLAKNETEGCQIVLKSEENMDSIALHVGDFTDDQGNTIPAQLYKIYYIPTADGKFFPDPIPPLKGSFSLQKNRCEAVLLQVASTAKTPAGTYTGKLTVKSGEQVLRTISVQAKVWDFALPVTPSCETAMGIIKPNIAKKHGISVNSLEATELYKQYYEFLLSKRISPYNLPVDLLDEEADQYLNDERMTSFLIPFPSSDELLKRYADKLDTHPEWKRKGMFYPVDEPALREHYEELFAAVERIKKAGDGLHIATPFFRNPRYNTEQDAVDMLTGKIDVWVAKSFLWNDNNMISVKKFTPSKTFAQRMLDRQASGDRVWWYVCWEPGNPYNNLFLDMEGLQHRLLFWQQVQNHVTGFLYWSTTWWGETENLWKDMATVKTLDKKVLGDGSLLYNGNEVGTDGPVSSLRLEAIRDGIDDIDYFTIAEKELGRSFVDECIAEVSTSLEKYTSDEELFMGIRKKLGDAIEKNRKG